VVDHLSLPSDFLSVICLFLDGLSLSFGFYNK
jgi:hypothetical protein